MAKIPELVAHRGAQIKYPENTLESLDAAFKAGACFVEFDVQITADSIPVLFHDTDLHRITGVNGNILELTLRQVKELNAGEKERLGDQFSHVQIPTLAETVALLQKWPSRHGFLEIKIESLKSLGIHKVVKTILQFIEPILGQLTIISEDLLVLSHVRALGAKSIGWVMAEWNNDARSQAAKLVPNYLICNHQKIPPQITQLWPGPWKWMLYDVVDPQLARVLATWGAAFIETFDIENMLKDSALNHKACFEH